jgi:adenosylcobinamide hydrolase
VRARYILNHQVEANPIAAPFARRRRRWEDPARYLGRVARRLGGDAPCVGLMTAVSLKQLVVMREETDDVWIEGFFTVGISNAVRAGESTGPIQRNTSESAGTINMVLVTNARLTSMALVGAVQVATESKTAALLSRRIRSWTGRPGATGTGTDAVVVVSGEGRLVRYSGTHTQFGEMVGRLVRRGVSEGLIHSKGGSTIGLRR